MLSGNRRLARMYPTLAQMNFGHFFRLAPLCTLYSPMAVEVTVLAPVARVGVVGSHEVLDVVDVDVVELVEDLAQFAVEVAQTGDFAWRLVGY